MLSLDWPSLRNRIGRRAGSIGLEIEDEQIRIAQLEKKQGVVSIRDVSSLKLPSPAEEILADPNDSRRIFNEAFGRGRFKGHRVVTHVPSALLRLMVLNYTADTKASESSQILDLAQERIRGNLDDYVIDYVPIRTSGERTGERSALVAVAPEEPVIEHLERLRRAGLVVEALEIAPVSVRRLVAHLPSQASSIVLLIRFQRSATELTVLSGKRLLLFREVEGGYGSILSAAAKAMECDESTASDLLQSYGVGDMTDSERIEPRLDPEAAQELAQATDGIVTTLRETVRPALRQVVDQAHKAVSYAAFQTRGQSLDKVYVLDGDQTCAGLEELLSEMLQLPVELLDPAECLDSAPELTGRARVRESAVAIGMALRGFDDV
jgi:type IV pilus assembly protein PilM